MIKDTIFGTAGGLALFMFGMMLMSEGLRKAAGTKLKDILESMTKRRLFGFLVGAGVTALIQSSSASTVMVVGFVNAGLLSLKQSIAVIIGTNVGTTATAWLVSLSGFEFKISSYALPAVAVGFVCHFFAKQRRVKNIGEIILGFGILFVGISFMKDAFSGLESSQRAQELFVSTSARPLLALLAGIVLTMLIQSSSAAVASVQLLAAGGAFGHNWETALALSIPFILGSNIGTTITAQLAALGANRNARRAAMAHTLFNVVGSFVFFWFIKWVAQLVIAIAPWELGPTTIAASIAVAHSSLKLCEAVLFLPLTGVLEKIVYFFIRRKDDREAVYVVLDKHLLDTPVIALEQTRREIVRMAQSARDALLLSIDGLLDDDLKKLKSVYRIEEYVDMFQFEITAYLSELSRRELSDELSDTLPVLLHTVNDLERIGDHAVNIAEIGQRKIEHKLVFTGEALTEASQLRQEAENMSDIILTALHKNTPAAAMPALVIENNLNTMQRDFRRSHVKRMGSGECDPLTGLIFIDLVDNVEKAGDHMTNIAQAVMGGLQWDHEDE